MFYFEREARLDRMRRPYFLKIYSGKLMNLWSIAVDLFDVVFLLIPENDDANQVDLVSLPAISWHGFAC